ncbi:hypothetical protein [Haloferula sargassicola]|uniref:Tetratricopeptide repeat protein n=1 Tax=Haloferula sargassicola TaxID=490096 RepID=A0ABP9UUF0_9BACT
MKRLAWISLIVAVLAGVAFTGWFVHRKSSERSAQAERNEAFERAGDLLQSGRADEALELLQSKFQPDLAFSELVAWPDRMAEAAAASRHFGQLENLVARYPAILREVEPAALWWLRMQLHRDRWDATGTVLDHWPAERQQHPDRWKLLEADHLLVDKRIREARESLESWSGEGEDEVNRQLRLALLSGDDEAKILSALDAARQALPESVDLHATAARYLERFGHAVMARREYIAAFLLEPDNPFHGDQLARFYLRTAALPQAIETWRQTAGKTGDVRSWWNVWFWERVTVPRGEKLEPKTGDWWAGVALDAAETPDADFLPAALLGDDVPPILSKNEAYHWLRVLQAAKGGDDARVLAELDGLNVESDSISRDLLAVMKALYQFRVNGEWPEKIELTRGPLNHRFLQELAKLRPAEAAALKDFLSSKLAPAAVLLANGWTGAADRLVATADIVDLPPIADWLPFAWTKSTARLHGPQAGLEAAAAFPEDMAVRGLAGELMLSAGKTDEGLEQLETVANEPGGVGFRASYLLALADLERSRFDEFDTRIAGRKDLAESVGGRELTARAALARKDEAKARAIYDALGTESVEGCVFRYRAAMDASDKAGARTILQDLIRIAPNEPVFHQWLNELDRGNS